MLDPRVHDELIRQLEALPLEQQRQVVEFARHLTASSPRGVPGAELLRFANTLPADQADELSRAVDQGCGRVDTDGW